LHPIVIRRFSEFAAACDPALRAAIYARLERGNDLLAAPLTRARAEALEDPIAATVFLQTPAMLGWAGGARAAESPLLHSCTAVMAPALSRATVRLLVRLVRDPAFLPGDLRPSAVVQWQPPRRSSRITAEPSSRPWPAAPSGWARA
jgi:hypothetical protein